MNETNNNESSSIFTYYICTPISYICNKLYDESLFSEDYKTYLFFFEKLVDI